MKSLSRWIARCAVLVAPLFVALPLLLTAPPAQAVTEADLLPVDQAFALSAKADGRDRIALTWKIAPGYYLYRHRISVKSGQGFTAGALDLPEGESKHDEFFGQVQTYRTALQASLAGKAAPGQRSAILQVQYQGCADAGVCYPPQRRELRVDLPDAPTAAPPRESLGALVPRGPSGARLFGAPGQTAGVDALPLPADQAFNFEAIVGDGNSLLLRFTPAPATTSTETAPRCRWKAPATSAPACRGGRRAAPIATSTSAMWWCISTRPKSPCRCCATAPIRPA